MYLVNVNMDCCTGCGECVNICPVQVYQMGANGRLTRSRQVSALGA